MRLGPLVMQVCAVLLALTLIYFGYTYLQSRELTQYAAHIEYPKGTTPSERISYFQNAPDMSCTFAIASFQGAASGKVYISKSKVRYSVVEASTRNAVHTLFLDDGLYIWDDNTDVIAFLPGDMEYLEQKADTPVFSLECSRWTFNPDAFNLPLGKPIQNMQTLKVL